MVAVVVLTKGQLGPEEVGETLAGAGERRWSARRWGPHHPLSMYGGCHASSGLGGQDALPGGRRHESPISIFTLAAEARDAWSCLGGGGFTHVAGNGLWTWGPLDVLRAWLGKRQRLVRALRSGWWCARTQAFLK